MAPRALPLRALDGACGKISSSGPTHALLLGQCVVVGLRLLGPGPALPAPLEAREWSLPNVADRALPFGLVGSRPGELGSYPLSVVLRRQSVVVGHGFRNVTRAVRTASTVGHVVVRGLTDVAFGASPGCLDG